MSGQPLSILQILTHYRINSGGAMQAFLLSRELVRLGHRVTMVLGERKDGTKDEVRKQIEGIGCRYVGLRLRGVASIMGVQQLLREGFDVVHLHRELALQRFLQAAPLSPAIGAVANVGTSKIPNPSRSRRLRSRRIDRVVVVAEALKRLLVCASGLDPTRIDVVYGAFDEERFLPDVEPLDRGAEFDMPADGRLIGMIANVDPKKGHRMFLSAARKVCEARDDCWFLLVGKGEPENLAGLVAESGLRPDRLIHLGFRDDIPRLLRSLDLSVCASTKGEGLTGAIREAMAMGTPVVSTAVAGNVEIVRQRETGLLVPPGDPDALAGAILEALSDPDASRQRALRGASEVRDRFTSRQRALRMAEVYQEIADYRRVRQMSADSILYPQV